MEAMRASIPLMVLKPQSVTAEFVTRLEQGKELTPGPKGPSQLQTANSIRRL